MKKIVAQFLMTFLVGVGALYGQKFYWAHSAESYSNITSDIRAIEVTSDGHTIAFGIFNNRLFVDDFVLEETDSGLSFFLAKYDPNGDVVWIKHIQSDEYYTLTHNQVGLALDDSDNIYISSEYEGTLYFGDVTVTNTEATTDYFVAKYDTNGELDYAWGQGADDAIAVDLAVDGSNNVYVAGHYAGDLRFDDPEETVLTSTGSYDAFVAKYDDEGTAIWARSFGDADNYDFSYGLDVNGSSIYWGVNSRLGTTSKQYLISVIRLSTDNVHQWTYDASSTDTGTNYFNQGNRLKAYGNDIYVVGYFRGGIQPAGEDVPLLHDDYQSLTFKIEDVGISASYHWATEIGDASWDYGYAVARHGSSVFTSRYTSPDGYIDELNDSDGSIIRSTTSSSSGTGDREYIYDIETYSSDRIVFAGYFDENIYYGENGNWTSESPGLILTKSDAMIQPDWLSGSYAFSISYDKSIMDEFGNTYVGGSFSGIMKEGADVISSRGGRDVIVEKYDASGNLIYRRLSGTELNDYFGDIAIHDNELYLTGVFDVSDGAVTLHVEDQVISGDEDNEIFLARYKESGDLDFAVRAASTEGDLDVHSIGIDLSGNIYLYGDARGSSAKSFGNNVTLAYDEQGFFLTKYNSAGHAQWVQSVNDTDDYEMYVSETDGIYISGKYSIADLNFEGTILPEEGFEDIFFAKYDYNGDFQWVVGGGGPSTDVIGGITVDDEDGSLYLTGYFRNSMTLSGNTVSGTNRELFTAKYDHLGNYEWLVSGGGARVKDQGKAIALDTAGNVVVVGQYEGDDATFDGYTPGGAGEYEVEALLLHYKAEDGSLIQGYHWGHPTNYLEGDDNEYFRSVFIDENNDLSIVGQFVDEVMLDSITVPIYTYYSSFVTKMSLSDCAYVGGLDFEYNGKLNVGETINFTDLTDLGAHTINEWRWNFGDESFSDEQNPMHSYSANGNYTVSLKVTYNTSCELEFTRSLSIEEKLNTAPIVLAPIQDTELIVEGADHEIILDVHFTDEDGQDLNFEVVSGNPDVASASIAGSSLTISPLGTGHVLITVTATDGEANTPDSFFVDVVETPNNTPVIVKPLSDMELEEGFVTTMVDVGNVFNDSDGDQLEYTGESEDVSVVSVNIVDDQLTITEVGIGSTTITVTSNDGRGGQASDHFQVVVIQPNNLPTVVNPLSDMELEEGFASTVLDVRNVFNDVDEDPLEYTGSSSDESVVTVSILDDQLTITEVGTGSTIITVTSNDGRGGRSTDHFQVKVFAIPNAAPEVTNPVSDTELVEGFATTLLDVSNIFEDSDADPLDYICTSSDESVVLVQVIGQELTITEVGLGNATVSIIANDGRGGEAVDEFVVEVLAAPNHAPVVANPLSDMEMEEGFNTTTLNITGVFEDQDDNDLQYSVSSSNESVVMVSVEGVELTITELSVGNAVVTLTSNDGNDGIAADHFRVTILGTVLGGIDNPESLNVYPNPTSDVIKIETGGETLEMVRVLDLSGHLLSTHSNVATFNMDHYENGTYMLHIITSENQYYRRVVRR